MLVIFNQFGCPVPVTALIRSLNRVAAATRAGFAGLDRASAACFAFRFTAAHGSTRQPTLGLPFCLLAVSVGLSLADPAPASAQDRPPSKSGPKLNPAKASSTPPGIDQVKAAPDDSELLKRFVDDRSRAAIGLLPQDPNGAERQLAELRDLLKGLKPTTLAGKRQLAESFAVINAYGKRVELARVELSKLRDELAAKPNQADLIHRYFDKLAMEVYALVRTDPVAARKLLDESIAFTRGLRKELTDNAAKRQFDQSVRRLDSLESAVGSSQRLAELLGKPAAPLAVESWAHGEPLAPDGLKGKVVLLDFWAVWCSPCVASLPKLDEWQRKWAAKGLVTIGLTQYYNFTWDPRAKRPVRSDGKVAPEAEREMLSRFAQQHGVRHRIALEDKDAKLSKHYRVAGIPHTVIIDQMGTVRLVRVGSGLKNARDIETLLTELLGPGESSNPRSPPAPPDKNSQSPPQPAKSSTQPAKSSDQPAKSLTDDACPKKDGREGDKAGKQEGKSDG